jgi:hypothetical protein
MKSSDTGINIPPDALGQEIAAPEFHRKRRLHPFLNILISTRTIDPARAARRPRQNMIGGGVATDGE